jgi:D-alanyl-lipoteichoic acid acyltransferase DltB (MBOAT superfamily)
MDFSGAIDIVIGVSQMFGVKLPENFRQPFASRSLSEFWRRWHMTLVAWVRDYVYIPLGGNRKGLARQIFNISVVWFITGFWHGGSWKWIFGLGVFSFVIIAGGKLLQPYFDKLTKLLHINTKAWSWHLFQSIRTFLFFTVSMATTRAEGLVDAFKFWRTLFTDMQQNFAEVIWDWTDKSIYTSIGLDEKDSLVLLVSLFILLVVSTLQLKGSVREQISNQNIAFRWLVYIGMFAAVIVFGMYGVGYNPADFIYAGF